MLLIVVKIHLYIRGQYFFLLFTLYVLNLKKNIPINPEENRKILINCAILIPLLQKGGRPPKHKGSVLKASIQNLPKLEPIK